MAEPSSSCSTVYVPLPRDSDHRPPRDWRVYTLSIASKFNTAYHAGKTAFLNYALVRRLQKKLVTVYCRDPDFAYIFSGDGFRKMPLTPSSCIDELVQNEFCCALVDLGDGLEHVPRQFHPHRLGRVVIATRPDEAHLSNFSKKFLCIKYYMPAWSWDNIYCGRSV